MTVDLIVVGKTDMAEVAALVDTYHRRVNRYLKFNLVTVPDPRRGASIPQATQKQSEGEAILRLLRPGDHVVLLDERGAQFTSLQFADRMQKLMAASLRRVCFVIGGPYGFSQAVRERADESISLSKMTFSHQIVRAIFAEQLYRALAIINNEPYHHE